MKGSPLKRNVQLSVVVFFRTNADPLRTECFRNFGLNTNIAEQLLDVLPIVTTPFGWNIPKATRFKAFWYDEEGWLRDPKECVSPQDAERLLVAVDETVADKGVWFYKVLIEGVPAYKDLVARSLSRPQSQRVTLSEIVSPEVSVMGVKLNLKRALDVARDWLRKRQKDS